LRTGKHIIFDISLDAIVYAMAKTTRYHGIVIFLLLALATIANTAQAEIKKESFDIAMDVI